MAVETTDAAAPPEPMRMQGRVLAGALEMRQDVAGSRGYYIAARADIPNGASLLQELQRVAAVQAQSGSAVDSCSSADASSSMRSGASWTPKEFWSERCQCLHEAPLAAVWEAPLAAGLASGALERVCRCCLEPLSPKMLANPLPCPACRRVRYCSTRCIGDDRDAHAASGECHLLANPDTWSRLGSFTREAACAARLLQAEPLAPPLQANTAALTDASAVSGTEAAMLAAAAEAVVAARAAAATDLAAAAAAAADAEPAVSPEQKPAPAGAQAVGGGGAAQDDAAAAAGDADGAAWRLQAALEAVCRVVTNGLEVLHEEGVLGYSSAGPPPPPAAAVYRLTSRLNHSCRPNAAYHFRPGAARIAVRSLQAIAKGDEVTISYTDLLQPAALRRASLAERYCFDCGCARCQKGGAGGDAFLGAAGISGSSVEASLAAAVEHGTQLFLEQASQLQMRQGDPGACQAVLLEALAASNAAQGGPLHHRALEAHCCLASACRVAARRAGGPPAAAGGHRKPICGGDTAAVGLQATAAAHALVLAAALQRLVSAGVLANIGALGEVGVRPQCGKQWSEAAGLLCELLALLPAASGGDKPMAVAATAAAAAVPGGTLHDIASPAVDSSVNHTLASGGAAQHSGVSSNTAANGSQHLHPWPGFAAAVQSAWRQLLALEAGAPGDAAEPVNVAAAADAVVADEQPAAKRRRPGSTSSAHDAGGAPAGNSVHIGVLLAAGAEGGLCSGVDYGGGSSCGSGGRSGSGDSGVPDVEVLAAATGQQAATTLAAAAAQCMALAGVHLKVAFGDSHPATETNAFLPFAAGLPFGQAAGIVQQASSLRQRAVWRFTLP